MAVTQFWY